MHRIGGLEEITASRENVELAFEEAKKNRGKHNALAKDMERFASDYEKNIEEVMYILKTGEWEVSEYRTFYIRENGKTRRVDWNPSFRDSVIQHALFRTIGVKLNATLIKNTFSGIRGRGMHHGMKIVMEHISKKRNEDLHIMKVDIHHYYESIDNEILKNMLSDKLKDVVIIHLLHALIDSHPNGLPIGNFLSQMLANFYLNEIDHWSISYGVDYFRYCDDIIAISNDRQKLKSFMKELEIKLKALHLSLKPNKQIFPIDRTNGLDFMGFNMTKETVRLRKRIERNFRRSASSFISNPCDHTLQSLEAYHGWTSWLTDGKALWETVLGEQEAA